MGHDHQPLARVLSRERGKHVDYPLIELAAALAGRNHVLWVARAETSVMLGPTPLTLSAGVALKDAQIALPQAHVGMHCSPAVIGDRLRRLQSAAKIAAIQAGEALTCKAVGEEHGLTQSLLVERAVQVALDAALGVPRGLAMTHHDEFGAAAETGPLARRALARTLWRAHGVRPPSSWRSWRAGVQRRRSSPDTDSRGACRPEWWKCSHARAFPEPRAGLRLTAVHAKQMSGAACE